MARPKVKVRKPTKPNAWSRNPTKDPMYPFKGVPFPGSALGEDDEDEGPPPPKRKPTIGEIKVRYR